MGIFDKLKGEFIDVIEYTDDSLSGLVHRFERHGNEIKNGAQLTVRESQTAIFVNEGEMGDIFKPGHYKKYSNPHNSKKLEVWSKLPLQS